MNKNSIQHVFAEEHILKKISRIMRLIVALLIIGCLHVAAAGHGQDKITIKLKSAELRKILITIEKKSSYRFLFNEALLDNKPKIDVDAVDIPVTQVLDEILSNTGISYKLLENKLIVLKATGEPGLEELQEVQVSGRVTGASGEPLSGVSVAVKGSRIGTTTDANGNFSLTVSNDAVLVFTYVGYESKEVAVSGRKTIDVSLQLSTKTIDQVIIVGYGTQRKIDVTGSVSQIKGDEVAKQPGVNPVSSLQGKVAGVQITNSGHRDHRLKSE